MKNYPGDVNNKLAIATILNGLDLKNRGIFPISDAVAL